MKQTVGKGMRQIGTIALMLCGVGTVMAWAQPPGGGPPPGMRPGGGPPPPGMGRGGRGGRGMGMNASALNAPTAALSYGLKLSSTQTSKISAIQSETRKQFQTMMPRMGGGPPNMGAMQSAFDKIRQMEEKNTNRINALLTPAQKSALPGVLNDVRTLQSVGIPAEMMPTLKLTGPQKTKLASIGESSRQAMRQKMQGMRQGGNFMAIGNAMQQARQDAHKKALAVLTGSQKSQVEQYLRAHPQGPPRGFGFPGGGPPPGGGPMGRPGGFGGPPPPRRS